MAEYIERKMLKSEMTEAMCGTGYQQWAIDVIDRLPAADVVEVVRCKDCVFYEKVEYYHPTDENAFKNVCRLIQRQMQYDDFCSYGVRKEGEEV